MVVDSIDGSKSSDDLENENDYDGIENVKTTSSDNVGDDETVKKQDDMLTLWFIEKSNTNITGDKTMNCWCCCCCCCFSYSAHWLPAREKLLYTVANLARGLLKREKK